jgi:hypothetical protein
MDKYIFQEEQKDLKRYVLLKHSSVEYNFKKEMPQI